MFVHSCKNTERISILLLSHSVTTYDVSALEQLNDYEGISRLVTLQPNSTKESFRIIILDDDIVENVEEFGVRVTSTDPQVNVYRGEQRVFIEDNDSKGRVHEILPFRGSKI